MSNARAHAIGSAVGVGGAFWLEEHSRGTYTPTPFLAALVASTMGSLPDVLEPACHPHHRQFFHSVVFAAGVGYVVLRVYRWQAETPIEKLLRFLSLAAGGAYLAHLAMDATTSRSIPVLGKLS